MAMLAGLGGKIALYALVAGAVIAALLGWRKFERGVGAAVERQETKNANAEVREVQDARTGPDPSDVDDLLGRS